jgi:DNA recombination protein RmuC
MSAIVCLCLFGCAETIGFNNVNQLGDGAVAVKPSACDTCSNQHRKCKSPPAMPGFSTLIIIALTAVILLLVMIMLRRQPAGDDTGLAELRGQLAQMAGQSGELQKVIASQMAESEGRLGTRLEQSLRDQNERTTKSLTGMAEKLAVITEANNHISQLSGQVTQLQNILSNKQARGSFGEVQLENLVKDALPDSAFSFQHTLTNGRRVDCFITMPNPPGSICIDSKFPLESFRALTEAADEAARVAARRSLEGDVKKHINDIAQKYIVPGETAESAILFLPSESVYAEINLQLPKLVEASRRAHVYMAGPDNLMLILHTVRAILRDAQMHEAAGQIQKEVDMMMQDVTRLDDRVAKLATHFQQAEKDISDIQTSTRKITSRGQKITQIEVAEERAVLPVADAADPKPDLLS